MQVFTVIPQIVFFQFSFHLAALTTGYALSCPDISLLCNFGSHAGSILGHLSCDQQLVNLTFWEHAQGAHRLVVHLQSHLALLKVPICSEFGLPCSQCLGLSLPH